MKKNQIVILPIALLLELKERLPLGKNNILALKGEKIENKIILQEILQKTTDYKIGDYRPVAFRQIIGKDTVFLQLTPQLKTTLSEEALAASTELELNIEYVEPLAIPKKKVLPNSGLL